MDITKAAKIVQQFRGENFTNTLAKIEKSVKQLTSKNCLAVLADCGVRDEVLVAAGKVKTLAGQIHLIIHAAGILMCLPKILEADEVVEYVSLGAANNDRKFDLETNNRIAEFKFICWRGQDQQRQNSLFKDFYGLAEDRTLKKKFMYVLGTERPLKFLNGRRNIASALDIAKLRERFEATYGDKYQTVCDYYQAHRTEVILKDISSWVKGLCEVT